MTHCNLALPIVAAALMLAACSADSARPEVVGELASERITLSADYREPVVEFLVAEGASVSSGETILQLDPARAEARLAEATAAQRQAQAQLDELLRGPREEQIRAARATREGAARELEFRDSELQRIAQLHDKGLASQDALDKANAALDGARADDQLRRAQLAELLAGTTAEELAQAEQILAQALAREELASLELERHTIVAPVDGIMDTRLVEPGETTQPGQAVAILLPDSQVYARVYVPEPIRVRVQPGTAAEIHIDGFDRPLKGTVRWVSAEAAFTPYYALTERDRGRLSYLAKIDIEESIRRLPEGVPVNVAFELEST